jgi:hypothetical protein
MGSLAGRAGLVQSGLNNLSCKKKEPSLTTVNTIEQGETMKKKINCVSPTNATDAEMKRFLLKHAINGLQKQAGFVPEKTDLIDNEPTFAAKSQKTSRVVNMRLVDAKQNPRYGSVASYVLYLRCEETMCWECAKKLKLFLNGKSMLHFVFVGHGYLGGDCTLCGKECRDQPFPF